MNDTTLRVAFPYSKGAQAYEPTNIRLAPEYIFLENIFSTIVGLDKKGKLIGALAETFEWKGNDLHLQIRDGIKTIDGYTITAKDVEFSLKRVLVLTGNNHGNLNDILCPGTTLKSINDICPNLSANDNKIIIKTSRKLLFLLPMLTAMDFAIIPIPSVDPKTLKIIDYRNTSGIYYVKKDEEKGNILLGINKNHFLYSPKAPQQISLVPMESKDSEESLDAFKAGEVDLITTIDSIPHYKILDYYENNKDSTNLHKTLNIRNYVLAFREMNGRTFSENDRLGIGNKVKQAFAKEVVEKHKGFKESHQFIPTFGEGSISTEKETIYKNLLNSSEYSGTKEDKKIKVNFIRLGGVNKFTFLKEAIPSLELGVQESSFKNLGVDATISGPDTGFLEDIGLISYSINAGYMGITRKEGEKWLKKYMWIKDKNERLAMFRDLHYSALKSGKMIPLASAPYVALIRKGWKTDWSGLYANQLLWQIEKEN